MLNLFKIITDLYISEPMINFVAIMSTQTQTSAQECVYDYGILVNISGSLWATWFWLGQVFVCARYVCKVC